jgi:hypothetical protein
MEEMIFPLAINLIKMDKITSSAKDILSTLHVEYDDSTYLK